MTIEKLKSGSYRISQRENGIRYRVTVDHKPTKNEAVRLLAERIEKEPRSSADLTVRQACDAYIDSRTNVISPSTVTGYRSLVRRIPDKYADMRIMQVTNATLQSLSNDYAKGHGAKTVNNIVSFVIAALSMYDIDLKKPTIPQKEKKSPYIPTKEEVSAVFDELKGNRFEIPITLAALGLRRSEICAVTGADIDGNKLTINKALVQDENGKWIVKTTKTTESTRTVIVPPHIADFIRENGYAYKGEPGEIYKKLKRVQDKLGIPRFTLHKMRHFFASYMHDRGYTDKQIQEAGGWKTDNVMKTVYQHAMDLEKAQQGMADDIAGLRS